MAKLSQVEKPYEMFGQRVKDRRKELGMRQEDLAALTGLTRASIANIEAGKQRFPLHVIYEFANALAVDPLDLFPVPKAVTRTVKFSW